MFLKSLTFEWRYFIRQPAYIILSFLFFLVAFLATSLEQVQIGISQNTQLNSAYIITQMLLTFNVFGIFLVVHFIANTALRNRLSNMHEIIFSKVTPWSYFFGSFCGSLLIVLSIYALVPLGILIGTQVPWLDNSKLGDFSAVNFWQPYIIYSMPTLIAFSCLIYAFAQQFKSMVAAYLGALFLLTLYLSINNLIVDSEFRIIVSLFDPFALTSFSNETRFWSLLERNTELSGYSLDVLANRLFWLIIGALALWQSKKHWASFVYTKDQPDRERARNKFKGFSIDWHSSADFGNNQFQKYLMRTYFEAKSLIMAPSFIIIVLFCLYMLLHQLVFPITDYGITQMPLTHQMVSVIINSFGLLMIVIIVFYSAEILWREENHRVEEIIGVTSATNAVLWLAKLTALCTVGIIVYSLGIMLTIIYQVGHGIFDIDIQQYLLSLFYFSALPLFYMTILSFFIQSISPNKYVGMFIYIIYILISLMLVELGFEHHLLRFSEAPAMYYSDMNQYAWSLKIQQHYMIYWGSLSLFLAVISFTLWRRGNFTALTYRIRYLAYSLGNAGRFLCVLSIIGFVSMAIIIHYNTVITNEFLTSKQQIEKQVNYERKYLKYIDLPLPETKSVKLDVALYPSKRKAEVITKVELINNSQNPVDKILINLPDYSHSIQITSQLGEIKIDDLDLQTAWFVFYQPIAPEQQFELQIALTRQHFGFKDNRHDTSLINNGTALKSDDLLPVFGVNQNRFLQDPIRREDFDLPSLNEINLLSTEAAAQRSLVSKDASIAQITTNLSTEEEQVAIAPGELIDYWQAYGRNYFIYQTHRPITNLFSIYSADWQVYAHRFENIDISIHHHKAHNWNIDNMMQSIQIILADFNQRFGPYPLSHLRIVEFPRYSELVQNIPGTIGLSEDYLFNLDLRDDNQINLLFYFLAYELAQQWFTHQLNIADLPGAHIFTETLAKYAALSLTRDKYGDAIYRQLLLYELQKYLNGRTSDTASETGLIDSFEKTYLTANKGTLVMMSLAQSLGLETLDKALMQLIEVFHQSRKEYITASDLLSSLLASAELEEHAFIDELFAKVVMHDLELNSVKLAKNVDGENILELMIEVDKFSVDEQGNRFQLPFNSSVDIALLNNHDENAQWEKTDARIVPINLKNGQQKVQLAIDTLPHKVILDPFLNYIELDTSDNLYDLD